MPNQFTSEEIRKKYDEFAHKYDRILMAVAAEYLGVKKMRHQMLRDVEGDILEVAVGTGKNLKYYPKNNCRITAVDMSSEMLKKAKRVSDENSRRVVFAVMDAQRLAFPDACFGTVITSCCLCTFPDPIAALKELKRVCKNDGRILLLEHGRSSVERLGKWMDKKADKNAEILGCYWNREPQHLVQNAGLTLLSAKRALLGIFHLMEAKP